MGDITTPTTTAATEPSVRAALTAAILISIATLGLATFELSMSDWPSGFVLLVLFPLTALTFIGGGVWSLTLLLRVPRHGAAFAAPLLIYALTLAVLAYAPLQEVALQRNFAWHRASRERIVARIEAGELKPNVTYDKKLIALGENEAGVSAGGNDIVVDRTEKGSYVLFLTSRGLKHYFSGFLHVPAGADPKDFFEFDDKPPSRLVRYDKDWYFVAN
jgi:hypothetical protein